MTKSFKNWFVSERARALAMILLTRRDDLTITGVKDDLGLDFVVSISTDEDTSKRAFGVVLRAAMSPVTTTQANAALKPTLADLKANGPFQLPVCIFYFTVKEDQAFYTWSYEPLVTDEGRPKLKCHTEADCQPLDNDALAEIIASVSRWFDAFYADIAMS